MISFPTLARGKWFHIAFKAGVLMKGLDGILGMILGAALWVTSPGALRNFIARLTRGELLEDPGDFTANHLVQFFNQFSISTQHFAALYLLAYGAVKTGLALGLIWEKLWVFPVALVLLCLFILVQIFRFTETHSVFLAFLTLLDGVIVLLIWLEYRRLKAAPALPAS
jgi:uncharacterized membrane protein